MKLQIIIANALFVALLWSPSAIAATDGNYTAGPITATWAGTYANLLEPTSPDYNYVFGDEEYLTYDLPPSWQFKFYGRPYSQITVDTNGNIWFGSARSANSFALPNAGLGRVAVAWNDNLSSLYGGGVFVQHLTSPERVVIEWQTETFTDEGTSPGNTFEVVLFDNGNIRFDYKPVNAATLSDFGSGISKDDTIHYLSITDNYGSPTAYDMAKSILFTPIQYNMQVTFAGTGAGTVTSSPPDFVSNTTHTVQLQAGADLILSAAPDQYSLFNGWTNGCNGTSTCQVILNSNTSVTATFDIDTARQIRRSGTYYLSLQEAYNAAITGDTIYAWGVTLDEGLTANRAIDVTLQGGYDSGYANQVGTTVLHGRLGVSQGKVKANGITLR